MVVNKISKDKKSLELIPVFRLAERHETICAVSQVTSLFDEQFDTDIFNKIAGDRPIRRGYFNGIEIGSTVMGGAARYFIQFC